mgnify:CR=1 FL=1
MGSTEKVSPKEFSRVLVESYQEAKDVNDFCELVSKKSNIIMLRYFLVAIYYALDMVAIG